MAARNAILILGGMAPQDLDRLTGIAALTHPERDLVASWAAPPTWAPTLRAQCSPVCPVVWLSVSTCVISPQAPLRKTMTASGPSAARSVCSR